MSVCLSVRHYLLSLFPNGFSAANAERLLQFSLFYLSVESWLGREVTHNFTFIHRLSQENFPCQLLYLNTTQKLHTKHKTSQWLFPGKLLLLYWITLWKLFSSITLLELFSQRCILSTFDASLFGTFLISRQLNWKPSYPNPALRPFNLCGTFVNTSPHSVTGGGAVQLGCVNNALLCVGFHVRRDHRGIQSAAVAPQSEASSFEGQQLFITAYKWYCMTIC